MKMIKRPVFSLFSLSLFLTLISTTFKSYPSATSLIEDTCKKIAAKDPNISYDFCTISLQAANHSRTAANLRKLGLISIGLIRHNVTGTRRHIKKLLKKRSLDPFFKTCLKDCLELYSDAVPALKDAKRDYKTMHYEDAGLEVSSVMDASSTCEDGFAEKKGVVSPLTHRNNITFQLAAISLSIINMLQHNL